MVGPRSQMPHDIAIHCQTLPTLKNISPHPGICAYGIHMIPYYVVIPIINHPDSRRSNGFCKPFPNGRFIATWVYEPAVCSPRNLEFREKLRHTYSNPYNDRRVKTHSNSNFLHTVLSYIITINCHYTIK